MTTELYDLNALLADMRAGKPQRELAARYGISKSLVSRIAIRHGLRRKDWTKRPQHTCPGCGVLTWAESGVCKNCRGREDYPQPTADDALPEGAWVLDPQRRIQVWQPAPTVTREPAADASKYDRWSRDQAARREAEEQGYSASEARRAHQAYKRGDRSAWAVTGHRVHCRRAYRSRHGVAS